MSVAPPDPALVDPGYTEADLQEIIKIPRFLAAVSAYARDRATLGRMVFWTFKSPINKADIPDRLRINFPYRRLSHEVARRVRAGAIGVPDEIANAYPDITVQSLPALPKGLVMGLGDDLTYSELERIPYEINPLKVYRNKFDDEDLRVLIEDRLFLAVVDAFRQPGLMSMFEACRRMFGGTQYMPRDLAFSPMVDLVQEVIRRINDGQIEVPSTLRDEYPEAYAQQTEAEFEREMH